MAPITLPFVIIYALAVVGIITTATYIGNILLPYFNKLHTYVIKKGWL